MNSTFRHYTLFIFLVMFSITGQVTASEPAPDFQIKNKKGITRLSDLRGKVVYVDFWASWCAPCRKSFPWLNEMQKKYGDKGLTIIGINVDKERQLANSFLEKNPATFSMVYDPDGELASKYKLVGMPSAYLIDKQGNIQHTHVGFRTSKKELYEKAIRHLLNL